MVVKKDFFLERNDTMKEIVLAGGCFWGVEAYFKLIDGVTDTSVGYANGHKDNPTYEEVCRKNTGHAEVVKVTFDSEALSLNSLLKAYFKIIDPTVKNRQGPDIGSQYRTGIYYSDPADKAVIESFVKKEQNHFTSPIVTEVEPLKNFFNGEAYHQDYLSKNPNGYCHIPLDSLKKELGK